MKTVNKNKQGQILKNCKELIKNKMKSTSRLSPHHIHEMFNLTSSHEILFQFFILFEHVLHFVNLHKVYSYTASASRICCSMACMYSALSPVVISLKNDL